MGNAEIVKTDPAEFNPASPFLKYSAEKSPGFYNTSRIDVDVASHVH